MGWLEEKVPPRNLTTDHTRSHPRRRLSTSPTQIFRFDDESNIAGLLCAAPPRPTPRVQPPAARLEAICEEAVGERGASPPAAPRGQKCLSPTDFVSMSHCALQRRSLPPADRAARASVSFATSRAVRLGARHRRASRARPWAYRRVYGDGPSLPTQTCLHSTRLQPRRVL
jgi:hypothetical protein